MKREVTKDNLGNELQMIVCDSQDEFDSAMDELDILQKNGEIKMNRIEVRSGVTTIYYYKNKYRVIDATSTKIEIL